MTDTEINIAIAEACGWKIKETQAAGGWKLCCGSDEITFWYSQGKIPIMQDIIYNLPSYTTDLNAMHEAEKVLSSGQIVEYQKLLHANTSTEWGRHMLPPPNAPKLS